ncbi:TPA: peptide-methionine (S)-S-oxide reductase MsrA [Streptococcus suis]
MEEKIVLAGGCFWCMVHPFDQWEGVKSVISGYTGGHVPNPTYEQVKTKTTGHTEAVEITFDPHKISLEKILEVYWQIIDPTDLQGQFVDRGSSYRPEIFYVTETQAAIAEASRQKLSESGKFDQPIRVPISRLDVFYPAEDYHQDFYKKNPEHYQRYRSLSGRPNYHKAD